MASAHPANKLPTRRMRMTYSIAPVIGLTIVVVGSLLPLMANQDRSVSDMVWAAIPAAFAVGMLLRHAPSVRAQWLLERRITTRMATDYQRLRELIDTHQDGPFLLAPGRDALLSPRSYTGRHGRSWEVLRLDPDEVASAAAAQAATPVVCERFRLAQTAPVVWHRFDAMTVEHDRLRAGWGKPVSRRQAWRAARRVIRLSDRTGLDIASEDEIEGLISQLRHAQP